MYTQTPASTKLHLEIMKRFHIVLWQILTLRIIMLVSLLLIISKIGAAQCVWEITDTITGADNIWNFQISSHGNVCTVCCVVMDSVSGQYHTLFWRSDDAGRTWRKQDPHLSNRFITSLTQADSLCAIAVGDSGLILSTYDGGENWGVEPSPVKSTLSQISCSSRESGIIVGIKPITILIHKGSSWEEVPFTPDCYHGPVPNLSPDYEGQLYCHSYGGNKYRVVGNGYYSDSLLETVVPLYTTTDGWHTVDSVFVPFWPERDTVFHTYFNGWIESQFSNTDTLMVLGWNSHTTSDRQKNGVIARTFDGGQHWDRIVDTGKATFGFFDMSPISSPMMSRLSDTSRLYAGFGMYRTSDYGSIWSLDSQQFIPSIDPKSSGKIGMFRSTITADGSMIGAFMFNNYWKTAFLARLSSNGNSSVSSSLQTSQATSVYPNPASSLLHIESFGLLLTIVDPLDRSCEVRRIGDALDVSKLSPGVYYASDGTHRARFVKE